MNREKEEIGYSYYSIGHDTIYMDTTLEIQNPLEAYGSNGHPRNSS